MISAISDAVASSRAAASAPALPSALPTKYVKFPSGAGVSKIQAGAFSATGELVQESADRERATRMPTGAMLFHNETILSSDFVRKPIRLPIKKG
jgi:hypothetical protein